MAALARSLLARLVARSGDPEADVLAAALAGPVVAGRQLRRRTDSGAGGVGLYSTGGQV